MIQVHVYAAPNEKVGGIIFLELIFLDLIFLDRESGCFDGNSQRLCGVGRNLCAEMRNICPAAVLSSSFSTSSFSTANGNRDCAEMRKYLSSLQI